MLHFFTRIATVLKHANWLVEPHWEWLASINNAVPAECSKLSHGSCACVASRAATAGCQRTNKNAPLSPF
jgi:hypothetical protein